MLLTENRLPAEVAPQAGRLKSTARRRPLAFSIGALALTALAVTVGIYFYPELARTIQMHRM